MQKNIIYDTVCRNFTLIGNPPVAMCFYHRPVIIEISHSR